MKLSINFFIYLALIIFYCCSEDNDLLGNKERKKNTKDKSPNVYKIDVGNDQVYGPITQPRKKHRVKKSNNSDLLIEYYKSSEKLRGLKDAKREKRRIEDRNLLLSDIQELLKNEIKQIPKSQKTIIKEIISDFHNQQGVDNNPDRIITPVESEIQPGAAVVKEDRDEVKELNLQDQNNIDDQSRSDQVVIDEKQKDKEKDKSSKFKYLIKAYKKIKSINWKKKKSSQEYESEIELTEMKNYEPKEKEEKEEEKEKEKEEEEEEKETIEGVADEKLDEEQKEEKKKDSKSKFGSILSSLKPKKIKGFSFKKKDKNQYNHDPYHHYNHSILLLEV